MKKLIMSIMLLGCMSALAGQVGDDPEAFPWHFFATLGYVNYDDMVDKNVAIERIAGSRDLFYHQAAVFGIEVGVQTGLNSRLLMTGEQRDILGGGPVQAVISTFFDVLGTARTPIDLAFTKHTDAFVKAGMAYRQMHFDRDTINPKVEINPEVQLGVSKSLSPSSSIAIAYQGIYSHGVGLTVSRTSPFGGTGAVKGIPTQNGGLLIFALNAA